MTTIILLSLLGSVIAAAIGTFWYSNATPMGKIHMRFLGFDKLSPEEQKQKIEEAKPTMWKLYLGQMALSFLMSFFVVFVVTTSIKNGLPLQQAIWFPVMAWLCFTLPAIGGAIIWGNCERAIAWKKFFSDTLSVLVTILVIGLIAGLVA